MRRYRINNKFAIYWREIVNKSRPHRSQLRIIEISNIERAF